MPYPRLLIPLGAALFVVGLVIGARPGLLADLELRAHDAAARVSTAPPVDPRIAIVAVDEASLTSLGQWPWPRDVIGTLVSALANDGAAAIAFDILFSEPDRLGAPSPAAGAPTSTDAALAASLRAAPVAAGFALTFEPRHPGDEPRRCVLHPLEPVRRDAGAATTRLFSGTGVVCSMDALNTAASASGLINASPDSDGVLRRLPLFMSYQGRTYPSLALAAVHLADPQAILLDLASDGTPLLRIGERQLRVDVAAQTLIRQRGPGRTYPHISAADVINGRLPAGHFAGKVVFIGATALGVRDVAATALDPRFPGVELHATVADALLGGAASGRAPFAGALDLAFGYLGTALAVLLVWRLGASYGLAGAAVVGAVVWFTTQAVYASSGVVVPPVSALVGLCIGGIVTISTQVAAERHRADLEHRRRDQAQKLIVQTLTTLTETRDLDTGRHARRTQEYVRLLATSLATNPRYRRELTPDRIDLLATLAPLHDIGKVGISDAVLNKPGHLTDAEYSEMKTHATLGHESLLRAEHLAGVHDNEVITLAKEIVYTHHERWDGSGYPQGLRGTAIPLAGRLVAVVDVYDALVEARAYKSALPPERAVAIITDGRGVHFDPDVVDAFLRCYPRFAEVRAAAAQADAVRPA